jgi:hypothetical protein
VRRLGHYGDPVQGNVAWRFTTVLAVVFALLSGHGVVNAGPADATAAASPAPAADTGLPASHTPSPPPKPDLFDVGLDPGHGNDPGLWMSWSLVDRSRGRRIGSPTSATERTNAESSLKAWISADYLRDAQEDGRALSASQLSLMDQAIRASDDQSAETMYRSLGRDQIFIDLERTCGVHVTTSRPYYWAWGQITADDATRILDCVLARAPGYRHGDRLLDDLHHVDADGAFGIPQALGPGVPVAVKNGWTAHGDTGKWNVNCVASWDHYTLAVLTRYPMARQLDYGAGVCRDVTRTLLDRLA